MKMKSVATILVSTALLTACNQGTPVAKTEGAPMPTPTVSGSATEMAAGTQMAAVSMINAKVKKPIGDRPTSGYLTIENGGPTPETITALSSPDFARVELSDHVMEGGMDKMVKLDTLVVPGNGQLAFEPAGKHLMLFEPKRELKNGDSIKVTFTFSNSGPIETNFVVLNEIPRPDAMAGAIAGAAADPMAGHDMSGEKK
jgi:periplasmic copper chaperone A